jgi:hypothetical protein
MPQEVVYARKNNIWTMIFLAQRLKALPKYSEKPPEPER